MNRLSRLAAFRALAPDDGAGGGAPAALQAPEPGAEGATRDVDFEALADAAYETAEDEPEGRGVPDEEDAEADAAEPETDGALPETGFAGLPAELAERYPVVGHLMSLDEGLSNPDTAAEVLRAFAQGVAEHHGVDLASMLGLSDAGHDGLDGHPADRAGSGEPSWYEAGFASPEEFAAAPDYERAGFASQGEHRLAQRLAALESQVAPALQDRRQATEIARYEATVRRATPAAIGLVRAETGWTPTPEQVMQAARAYPQIAATSLPKAVQAAFTGQIVASARGGGRASRPRPDDMPLGAPRSGTRGYEPPTDGSVNWNRLADAAYDAVAAG